MDVVNENRSFNTSTAESEQPHSTWQGSGRASGGGLYFLGLASEENEGAHVLYPELKAA